jgi:hypothetical protein
MSGKDLLGHVKTIKSRLVQIKPASVRIVQDSSV